MSLRTMKKKSAKRGGSISMPDVEILNVSGQGIWIFVKGREYFLPYEKFPWFKKATVVDICKVKILHGYHLCWASLDIDLELSSLKSLKNYPLVYH